MQIFKQRWFLIAATAVVVVLAYNWYAKQKQKRANPTSQVGAPADKADEEKAKPGTNTAAKLASPTVTYMG
jgi:hypothetical protein